MNTMDNLTDTATTLQSLTESLARIERDQTQQIEQLKRILEVTRLMNATLDLEMQLKMIQDVAVELTKTEVGAVFLRESKTDELFFLSATGDAAEKLKKITVPMEGSVAGWVVKTGAPAVVNDVQSDDRHYPRTDDETQFETRSLLAVPLIAQDKIIGALEVTNKVDDKPFTNEDLDLLTTLAAQAAVAIEKARLFEQSDLLSEVVHELRTPMTSIIGYSKMLTMEGIPEATKQQFIETIHREATRLGQMVNDFLEWARLEAGRVRFKEEPVDICQLVGDVVLMIEPQARERSIVVEKMVPASSLIVTGDGSRLEQVILNLASNGVKYNRDNGRLDFIVKQEDDQVSIAVRDTGAGISKESLDKLFERFYRVPGTENVVRGTGLGLNIAKSLVEAHGGVMEVSSTVGVGTTFTVKLPLAT
jgi:signal transduction histidine kinase